MPAHAHFDFRLLPDVPAVGDPRGLRGGGPEANVAGGAAWLTKRNSTRVGVACATTTRRACRGVLVIHGRSGMIAKAPFELSDDDWHSLSVAIPGRLARKARRSRRGVKLIATARAEDNLGRDGEDTARIRLRTR